MSLYVETDYWENGYAEGDVNAAYIQPGGFYFEHRPKVKRKQVVQEAVEAAIAVVSDAAPEIRQANPRLFKSISKRLMAAVPQSARKENRKALSHEDHKALIEALEREIAEILAAYFETIKARELEDTALNLIVSEMAATQEKRRRRAMLLLLASFN